MRKNIANWGLYPVKNIEFISYASPADFIQESKISGLPDNLIAVGNNRCYGDANMSSIAIETKNWTTIINYNSVDGIIQCESGCTLDQILKTIIPTGYFLPVSPGTKFITVGGALASDIHGKNHHIDGVFSDHVLSFGIVTHDGNYHIVNKENSLFERTAGGMGLTGIITEITFKLKKISNSEINQTAIRARNLEHIFQLFEDNKNTTYSVAWIDCLAKGNSIGKSVLLLGEHNTKPGKKLIIHKNPWLNVPLFFPKWFLNSYFIKLFNLLYYHKPSSSGHSTLHYDSYFYPLDKINHWNRIYGKNGFVQWQCVIPKEKSFDGIKEILTILSENKIGSFLAVLKLFGKSHENRILHFPMEGYTLALDIKINNSIWPILDQLDTIVSNSGGKIYLTKDARMNKVNFSQQYKSYTPPTREAQSYQMTRLNQKYQDVLLLLGANSDIAKEIALQFIKSNPKGFVIMAGRNESEINGFIKENNIGHQSEFSNFDATKYADHQNFVDKLIHKPSVIVYAAGILIDNKECQEKPAKFTDMVAVNYTGAVNILNLLIKDHNPMLKRIIGISSVAGLRGRKSNFFYGSTKSGFHQFLFGLRQELSERGIIVQACTPGFVKTKMTSHLELPKIANSPSDIAISIIKNTQPFEIYPSFKWKIISQLVKFLPEKIVKNI